jgi:hypothetical protein
MALLMRVRAIFRRIDFESKKHNANEAAAVTVGRLKLDEGCRLIMMDDKPMALTPTEYGVLRHLMLHAGQAVSREELLTEIWGFETAVETRATDDTVRHASLTLSWRRPTAVNRILLGEPIALGQRIRAFRLEALVDGQWQPIRDSLADEDFSTIGYRRIVCFPTVSATQLRLTVTDARACPLLSRFSAYLATEE